MWLGHFSFKTVKMSKCLSHLKKNFTCEGGCRWLIFQEGLIMNRQICWARWEAGAHRLFADWMGSVLLLLCTLKQWCVVHKTTIFSFIGASTSSQRMNPPIPIFPVPTHGTAILSLPDWRLGDVFKSSLPLIPESRWRTSLQTLFCNSLSICARLLSPT